MATKPLSADDVAILHRLIDAGEPISRENAEQLVRTVDRRCKGPVKPEHAASYAELRQQMGGFVAGGDVATLDAIAREECGADFNDVICTLPFDGKVREVECQQCHQKITFSVFFPLKD